MSSRPPSSTDAGAATVASTEALDTELSSATFSSAGESGLSVTEALDAELSPAPFSSAAEQGLSVTTTVEKEEAAGSSDGTGSGTAALAVRQPEAGTAKREKDGSVRKGSYRGARESEQIPRVRRRRLSGAKTEGDPPRRRGATDKGAVARAEAVVETKSSILVLLCSFPLLCGGHTCWVSEPRARMRESPARWNVCAWSPRLLPLGCLCHV
jgi:hypothetical protein